MTQNRAVNGVLRISPKAARVNAEVSQKEAAKALGVDVSTLRRYENGDSVPPWDVVEKMEKMYGISREYIFFTSIIA